MNYKKSQSFGCNRCGGDEPNRKVDIAGVTFTNHKGSLAIVTSGTKGYEGETHINEDYNVTPADILLAMAQSLMEPPAWVSEDPYSSGDHLRGFGCGRVSDPIGSDDSASDDPLGWHQEAISDCDKGCETQCQQEIDDAAKSQAELGEWVSRCQRAAQLIIAAKALDEKGG